jgi:hypothetical protein
MALFVEQNLGSRIEGRKGRYRKNVCENLQSAARWPQPKQASPCSPTLQSLNTEATEDLSDLCVKFFVVREDTEALLIREEVFAGR